MVLESNSEAEREMGKLGFLAMKTDEIMSNDLIESDLRQIGIAAKKLANHAFVLGSGLGAASSFFSCLASAAAIYLLILDRTNWRTNMLTTLLVPYIFLSLPSVIFSLVRGEFGKWIAFIAIVLRLFFPHHFPGWLEMPGSLILLMVVAPNFFAHTIRNDLIGVFICLGIACYLLQEHIRASGDVRNSFAKIKGALNSIGIVLIMVYPVWCLVLHFM